jgi:thiamine-phosphate pyrophosphorylase
MAVVGMVVGNMLRVISMQTRRRQTILPSLWLMSDARLGRDWLRLVRQLPSGSGIILRDYDQPEFERLQAAHELARIARKYRLIWLWSGDATTAQRLRADGMHAGRGQVLPRRSKAHGLIRSVPVHNLHELRRAQRAGADMLLLSPIFATRSHAGAKPLGVMRGAALARTAHVPVIALGGMNARRAGRMQRLGLYGWAGIDAFIP